MNIHNQQLIALSDGLYLDAFVVDDRDEVIFISLWARDGEMQHLFAALTLPITQGGYREKRVRLPDGNLQTLNLNRVKDMKKITTRLPRFTPVGEWVHTWLILPELMKTPYGSHEGWILSQNLLNWDALWPVVKTLCHLPLLDEWKNELAVLLHHSVKHLDAFGVFAYQLTLEPELIEPIIADAVKSGSLPIQTQRRTSYVYKGDAL
ncbi:hypothetical protein TUM4438_10220 [Shewanella sairae]|uniref:Uncharacterized protein n=1 Tax=Shewanella sairae TaxID=190310 RepID=A0ABQ4P6P8_9GAMM|nr:hypothetical protein [Shewanella sairae]MCL1130456.1 hypothetical protein [Shewanella sairae]GIU42806.1 hypothetical protein TUM4438_10220 [Shewanella sairae]